jgi:hypothetical protein
MPTRWPRPARISAVEPCRCISRSTSFASRDDWYQPASYLTAAVLTIAPLTEWAIRSPAVLIGVVDVVLMFLLVRRLSLSIAGLAGRDSPGAVAGAFHPQRFAMDYIYPLPFILGWLLALSVYRGRRPRLWRSQASRVSAFTATSRRSCSCQLFRTHAVRRGARGSPVTGSTPLSALLDR